MVNTQGGLSDLRCLRNGREGGQQQHGHKEWSSHKHALRMRTHTHRDKTQPARTAPRDKTTGATRAFSLTCGGCPGARQRQDSGPGGEGRQAANGQGSRATHNHARQRGDGRACWWGANTLRGTARHPRNTQDGSLTCSGGAVRHRVRPTATGAATTRQHTATRTSQLRATHLVAAKATGQAFK
jgi:hypothetical protein